MSSRKPSPSRGRRLKRGFTYIELLITLSLIAILFVPMMQFFSHAIRSTDESRKLITALSLARWEMEKIKNLGLDTARVEKLSNTSWPPAEDPPLSMNGYKWRIDRLVDTETSPIVATVEVRLDGTTKPLAHLVTLIAETSWVQ